MHQGEDAGPMPNEWYCPISQELMRNPTIAADGFTYEKKAIEKWLQKSTISPMTGAHLANLNLIPNHALRNTIQDHLAKRQKKLEVKQPKVKYQKIVENSFPQIQFKTDATVEGGDFLVKCEIAPPPHPQKDKLRHPCSIICILDVSESMDTDSVLGGKDVESHGFSRLDLVKHSINTMIEFMGNEDQMGIVVFSNAGRVELPLRKTTPTNKILIKKKVDSLTAGGSTNIWDGLKVSLDLLKDYHQRNTSGNVFVVLLTDGQPNLNPPRGIVPTLKKFLDLQNIPYPNIHVFGYGYELDSKLLAEIAETGYGTYSYIPDCSMIGTVFVNFMAAALSTVTNKLILEITDIPTGVVLQEIVGFRNNKAPKHNLGALQFGQSREFYLRFNQQVAMGGLDNLCNIKVSFDSKKQLAQKTFAVPCLQQTINNDGMRDSLLRLRYLKLLEVLRKARVANLKQQYEEVEQFYRYVEDIEKNKGTGEFSYALLKQLKNEESENEGQVSKAFQKEQWFQKWGKHYIPSLHLAHLMQTCTNFKDPALQLYGGPTFQQNRNNMDTIFIKMAPPKPSAKKQAKLVYKPAPVDMGDYYNNWGGCIHEDCKVELQDGSSKKIKQLKRGDILKGQKAIRCVVKSNIYDYVEMVIINQHLIITPWHPIKLPTAQNSTEYQWLFPAEVPSGKHEKIFIESYYNFVMEDAVTKQISPSLECEGVECISLGHGLTDNPVVEHQYFGKDVLKDLQADKNWQNGLVVVRRQHRDLETKLVNKLEFEDQQIEINVIQ